jgi:hypothetical protein
MTAKGTKAALLAWATRRSPTYRARRTAQESQAALRRWAAANHWHLVFLDAPSGAPRTGIVDAVMIRIARHSADVLDVRFVQLKGGSAGLTATERRRLRAACSAARCEPAYAYFDGVDIDVDVPVAGVAAAARPRSRDARRR